MILNVSGRTDIVAFYTPWFMNRYKEGFVDARNPFNKKMVSRISFSNVDAILFCTKNPLPIIPYLKEIDKPIIFHITLTSYKEDIEPNLPSKDKIIEGIKEVSKIVGKDNIYVRYDPIFISKSYTIDYHIKAFEKMLIQLNGYINKVIISFLDIYKNVLKNKNILGYQELTDEDYRKIGINFSKIAQKYDCTVQTCFEKRDLTEYGFINGECISKELAFKLTGKLYPFWKARKGKLCKCVSTVDIGHYNSCNHMCKYCYANFSEEEVHKNMKLHDPSSSLLVGHLQDDDIIKMRI